MPSAHKSPRLYGDLASWWPLLSAPSDYGEEAEFVRKTLVDACSVAPQSILELGSGGGNNASHLKAYFHLTLVDLSPQMLDVSSKLNPECEHANGDMRTVRLNRQFDGIFVHDAVMYMTNEADLRQVMKTACIHCKEGGAAAFFPDVVRETFVPLTTHGGPDGENRSIRYFEWTFDSDPTDTTYTVDFVYLMREPRTAPVRVEHETHVFGIFSRADWLQWLTEAGFSARMLPDPWGREIFVGRK
jgi:SAM-dependent methyltransferase